MLDNNKKVAEQLMLLFKGNKNAYGTYQITGTEEIKGKQKGTAVTISKPPTIDLWLNHVNGKKGLGIIPITTENKCCWGCIDIDVYPVNHLVILELINKNKLPLVICRSKSNGAHCFIFLQDMVPAKDMRAFLSAVKINIGYAGVEIYPAQDEVTHQGNRGNWLNMPYFNLDTRTCVDIHKGKLQDLSVEEFLIKVKRSKLSLVEFAKFKDTLCTTVNSIDESNMDNNLKGAPPCLQVKAKKGIVEGERNNIGYNLAVYAKKRYGVDFEDQARTLIDNYMVPRLLSKEAETIIKSVAKSKEVQYSCKKEPLKSFCNSYVCVNREFGIDGSLMYPKLHNLKKVVTNPVVWYLETNTGALELNTNQFVFQAEFRKACVEQLNSNPPTIKNKEWELLKTELLSQVEIIYPPEDARENNIILDGIKEYIRGRYQSIRDVLKEVNGVFLSEDGWLYFKLPDLKTHLTRRQIIQNSMSRMKFAKILDDIILNPNKKLNPEDPDYIPLLEQEDFINKKHIRVKNSTIFVRGIHSKWIDLNEINEEENSKDIIV